MSSSPNLVRVYHHALKLCAIIPPRLHPARYLATVHTGKHLSDVWFTGSIPRRQPASLGGDYRENDERTLKLGKTLRILQPLLPTLLQTPLPASILSPQITLHLFPSTHPHLPTVSGRVAYVAALWTSPIAWGRVPIVGNVQLEILSERMVRKASSDSPLHYSSSQSSYRPEQLVVRWRTMRKAKGEEKNNGMLANGKDGEKKEFTGLFIFEFDEEGRIVSHTIEHVQEGGSWEKGVGARVVGLTDWLLGGLKSNEGTGDVCPAFETSETRV